MDFLISVKKVSKCMRCNGLGYYSEDPNQASNFKDTTIQFVCQECNSKGKIIKKADLSLESLKDLLK